VTRSLLVLLALPCVAACTTVDEIDSGDAGLHFPALQSYVFYVSSDVDVDGQFAIAEAVRQWTEYTDVQITVQQGDLGCVDVGCFSIHEVSFAGFDSLVDGDYIGYTVPYFIFLSNALATYDALQETTIHEMGHALGLLHPCVDPCSDYAVMNPRYKAGADHVACEDIAAFYAERPDVDASAPMVCTDIPGALDESSDGGPIDDASPASDP